MDKSPIDYKGFFLSRSLCPKSIHFLDIMSQYGCMSNDGVMNNLKQAILSRVELHGIEAAQSYCEAFPPLSVERRRVERVFAELEQDDNGNWRFNRE